MGQTVEPVPAIIGNSFQLSSRTQSGRPPDRIAVGHMVAMPRVTNVNGDILGGWLMSQVDLAGSVSAFRHAHSRIATVAVENFLFYRPCT